MYGAAPESFRRGGVCTLRLGLQRNVNFCCRFARSPKGMRVYNVSTCRGNRMGRGTRRRQPSEQANDNRRRFKCRFEIVRLSHVLVVSRSDKGPGQSSVKSWTSRLMFGRSRELNDEDVTTKECPWSQRLILVVAEPRGKACPTADPDRIRRCLCSRPCRIFKPCGWLLIRTISPRSSSVLNAYATTSHC
ncbi:hypothetical protein ARMSODRAFT_62662 [Armillaria solidipes]|uniref:Uncharacterized protein n=1 Tax=Armillaria solidipes TaxID=1076256 RepID=A0A2H3C2M9_9AGAR|nr:hypothetical protein ARMSODRAFT_62662 [Armillaria solidipes]